jgi:hypothetical protein
MASVIVRQGRLLNPGEAFLFDLPQPLDRLGWREGLVIVHHNRGISSDRAANRADDSEILSNGGVSDLRLNPGEPSTHPILRNLRRFRFSVVPDRTVRRHRPSGSTEQRDQ